jgi:predicted porin
MMKHTKFLALTAIAVAASSAMAESSVTLYGNLDLSAGNIKQSNTAWALQGNNPGNSTTAVSSGVMSESFIGFKGTEDLGGGMEAQFVLETYVDGDTGATSNSQQLLSAATRLGLAGVVGPTAASNATWNTRDEGVFWSKNAYVGLKTNFGLIRLGQMDNIGYLSAVKYNPFGSAAINPTTRVFYGTDYYARAWSNTIAYYLKSDGLLFGVQYAPKNDSSTTTGAPGNQGGAKYSATISYGAGPLNVSLGFESNKDNLSSAGESKSTALHGSYDFGVAKLYAGYGSGKLDSTAGQDVKSTGYQLGTSVPVGANGSFLASYAVGKLKADNTSSFAAGTTFRDVKVLSVGYTHSLSKRTGLYGVLMDSKDKYPVAGPGGALNNLKIEIKQFNIGVRHSF